MKGNSPYRTLLAAAFLAAGIAPPGLAQPADPPRGFQEPAAPPGAPVPVTKKIKVSFIGAGRIGGSYAQLFAQAGYAVMISARDLNQIKAEAARIGYGIQAGTADQAAAWGDVVIVSVPYDQLKAVARGQGAALKGKIVVDTNNPKGADYFDMTPEARALGSGIIDQRLFTGARLVKGLDTVSSTLVLSAAHHSGELAGVPLAADDKEALAIVATLVTDIGYAPVISGGLATAKIFDSYTPFHKTGTANSASEVARMLADKPAPISPEEVRRLTDMPRDKISPDDQAKLVQYRACCSF